MNTKAILLFMGVSLLVCSFFLGYFANIFFNLNKEIPFGADLSYERKSPADRIKEEQIHVYSDKIVIDLENAEWSKYLDTNSMDPFLDDGANGIEIVPSKPSEIKVGDIIAYQPKFYNGVVVHRVAEKGIDKEGIYFIVKGDNNPDVDPEKVRFEQIKRILVGIIY